MKNLLNQNCITVLSILLVFAFQGIITFSVSPSTGLIGIQPIYINGSQIGLNETLLNNTILLFRYNDTWLIQNNYLNNSLYNVTFFDLRYNSSVVIPYWINQSGFITSNSSINGGQVNITGNLTAKVGTFTSLYSNDPTYGVFHTYGVENGGPAVIQALNPANSYAVRIIDSYNQMGGLSAIDAYSPEGYIVIGGQTIDGAYMLNVMGDSRFGDYGVYGNAVTIDSTTGDLTGWGGILSGFGTINVGSLSLSSSQLTGLSGLTVYGEVNGYGFGYDDGMGTTSDLAAYSSGWNLYSDYYNDASGYNSINFVTDHWETAQKIKALEFDGMHCGSNAANCMDADYSGGYGGFSFNNNVYIPSYALYTNTWYETSGSNSITWNTDHWETAQGFKANTLYPEVAIYSSSCVNITGGTTSVYVC